jgi:hypothetical protein
LATRFRWPSRWFSRKIKPWEKKPIATERANDLQAFKSFLEEQLAAGNADLRLDEALAHWRHENEGAQEEPGLPSPSALQDNPDEWAKRLQAWVDTHQARPIEIDDRRESIYSGRGE